MYLRSFASILYYSYALESFDFILLLDSFFKLEDKNLFLLWSFFWEIGFLLMYLESSIFFWGFFTDFAYYWLTNASWLYLVSDIF